MAEPRSPTAVLGHLGRLAVLLLLIGAATALVFAPAGAQETPEDAAQTPPDPTAPPATGEASIRIELDAPLEPVAVGETIVARVLVENVEDLASFSFVLRFDPDKLRLMEGTASTGATPDGTPIGGIGTEGNIRIDDLGAFLRTSERGVASENSGGLLCVDPVDNVISLDVGCSTLGPPVCLGGAPGASGSGVLAAIPFESRGGGPTTLSFGETVLVLDDFAEPCDPNDGAPQRILHTAEGASIELAPKEDDSTLLIVVIIIVVVAVVVAAGGGFLGYRWYRQRQDAGGAPLQ